MMKKLLRRLKSDDYVYPKAALCIDSDLDCGVINKAENIIKQKGFIVIRITNFSTTNPTDDDMMRMCRDMDMQVIKHADIVYVIGTGIDCIVPKSIKDAIKYAIEMGKQVNMLHFI